MNTKPLKIIVMGYYGHLNAGDDLLEQAMTYIFQEHKLMFSGWFPGSLVLNECDLVVVGGGSIWPGLPVFQNAANVAKLLKVPLFIMGISAGKHDEEVKRGTVKLIERAAFFHVRDLATFKEFDEHPSVKVGVDLFWWVPWTHHSKIVSSGQIRSVAFNLRDWKAMQWSAQNIVSAIEEMGLAINALPLYFGSSSHDSNIKLNDADFLSRLGLVNVSDHWTYQPIADSDFSVAMRYHAVLLSTRMKKPVIGFNYHPKIRSFFEENGIPELCVALDRPGDLKKAITNLNKNYEKYVSIFSEIKRSLELAGRRDLEQCRNLLVLVKPAKKIGALKRLLRAIVTRL